MTEAPTSAFIALSFGGNRGPVEQRLAVALAELSGFLGAWRKSSLYRTAPVSAIPQDDFLNLAVVGETSLAAADLLAVVKALEQAAGRHRDERWGPRPLDIDLLLHGSTRSDLPELTLPHPHLRTRRFVLEPLAEIAPDLPVPPDGRTVGQLLAALPLTPGLVRRLPFPG